ncbi:MAG: glycoside hydrolase family 28 protein, partial [Phycisphaerales bacterium]
MFRLKQQRRVSNIVSIYLVLLAICSLLPAGCTESKDAKSPCIATNDLPFVVPDVKEPKFPNNTFRITDFGAIGDGHTKNTEAFTKAIAACVNTGGGKVVIPAGVWLTGPIQLKSNINLHVEEGAVVLFSPDFEDYPLLRKTWEGLAAVRCMPPLYGENLENIAFTGPGIFDGSGQAWRPVKRFKMTQRQWKALLASGGAVDNAGKIWWPSEEAVRGAETVKELDARGAETHEYAAAKQYLRPVMVGITKCKGVLFDGPTFQNSPAWNIHPLMCEDMIIRNINVRNPWWSQNGDGMDLESCRNVIVHSCRFDVGDDAICMKSGKNEYGRKRGKPTENVAIWDCTVYHGHGGFVCGSEMSGGIRNIYIKDCLFLGTDVGIRFKSTRGRGGVVENIYIQDIRMKDIPTDAVRFNMFYEKSPPSPEASLEFEADPVSEETPRFQNINMRNIICSGAKNAVYMQGLPEMPIQKINMENITMSADFGVTCIEADNIKFKNIKIMPKKGHAFGLYNSRNFVMENITFPESERVFVKVAGEKTKA